MTQTLTKDTFREKIFDFEENQDWKFLGERPAIIDFYADWCGPCKMIAPILEEISDEYTGSVDIYKVDTDAEQELAQIFGIQSIPSMLFIPLEEKPQMSVGALPKESISQAIKDVLKVDHP
ncbi:thioredoxin [Alkalispirochaeta americana]|uniref:thioredoxin n=1 Tax=Alkalispirochaeta americana TaxID=159291 RepID=UPI0009708A60|nr:thioredoxin [Alkalispirochaeta americana]